MRKISWFLYLLLISALLGSALWSLLGPRKDHSVFLETMPSIPEIDIEVNDNDIEIPFFPSRENGQSESEVNSDNTNTPSSSSGEKSQVVHHPEAVLAPENANTVTTAWEYMHTYAGLCPYEQPDGPFKADWAWLTAIGQRYEEAGPERLVEQYWNYWHGGKLSGSTSLRPIVDAVINWNTLIVESDLYLTTLLQDFENRYIALCPHN